MSKRRRKLVRNENRGKYRDNLSPNKKKINAPIDLYPPEVRSHSHAQDRRHCPNPLYYTTGPICGRIISSVLNTAALLFFHSGPFVY